MFCALKKLLVNLAADNPTGEVGLANMYTTSKPGCIILSHVQGLSIKQTSLWRIKIAPDHCFFLLVVRNTGDCRLSSWVGLAP